MHESIKTSKVISIKFSNLINLKKFAKTMLIET